MVVLCRTTGGSYLLAKLDSAISCLCYAAFWLLPYCYDTRTQHLFLYHSLTSIVTQFSFHLHHPSHVFFKELPLHRMVALFISSDDTFLSLSHNEHLSPQKSLISTPLVILTHPCSLMFHDFPWSVCTIGYYKYSVVCTTSPRLVLL